MPFEPQASFTPPHYLDQYRPADGRYISGPPPVDLGPPPPKPPALAPPANVTEADAQIAHFITDKKFADRLLNGDLAALREFHAAHEAKEKEGGQSDQLLSGNAETPILETVMPGQVSTQVLVAQVEEMRTLGLSDGAIKMAFDGTPVAPAELAMVKMWKTRALADKEFTKRYLDGDLGARREMTLANIVITNGAIGAGSF